MHIGQKAMRTLLHLFSFAALVLVAAAISGAQTSDDSKPAATNVAGAQYPRVYSDGRVAFKVNAPTAQKVQVAPGQSMAENNGINGLGKDPFDMVRDKEGVWTVITPPAVPGFHYYWLLVDGVAVNDPSSETFFGYNRETSGLDVPEPGVDFYLLKEVPHGEVRQHWYYSKLTSAWRPIMIYTPPGYDTNTSQRYPVLYLQHGGGENYTSWSRQGHVNLIMDNLISEGKAKPMIIVMENGSAGGPGAAGRRGGDAPAGGAAGGRGDANAGRGGAPGAGGRSAGPGALGDVFVKELIPHIDASYRTIADREHRAMAGLSMGSAQTLQITLANLDTFSYIGVFSRPPDINFNIETSYNGVFKDAAAFNEKVHLFWWGAGTAEPLIYQGVKATHEALDKANIKNVYVEFPGLAHEWQIWRKDLHDFAPRLFQ
jgi:enterochelin esterase-like enzyme